MKGKKLQRLKATDAEEIAEQFRAKGMTVVVRPPYVHIWDKMNGDVAVAQLKWVPRKGWVLQTEHPILNMKEDVPLAVDEVQASIRAAQDADKAFQQFLVTRSDKAWKVYQGTLAAHYMRHYIQQEEEDAGTDNG